MAPCRVRVVVDGRLVAEVEGRLAAIVPGVGVAVMLDAVPPALSESCRAPSAPEPSSQPADAAEAPGLLSERLKLLSPSQKMALALSCDRETRFALLRDVNKALHLYVLRNPRIGLDEVQAAAKMATLSPDALKYIAEHREWGANPAVCTALVKNPRMLLPLALKLLDRIPHSEVRVIAKGGARDQLVQAARKKLAG